MSSSEALPARNLKLVFLALMLGMFLAALDQTIVATALPASIGAIISFYWLPDPNAADDPHRFLRLAD